MGAGAVPCARLAALVRSTGRRQKCGRGGSEWRAGGDSGGLGRLRSACPTDPACGRWENAAAESKQISGLMTPRVSAGSWQLKTHAPQSKC
jgi:hypothetical protein